MDTPPASDMPPRAPTAPCATPDPASGTDAGPRLLYLIPDGFPTHRADVTVLFGQELPRRGISVDLVAQNSPNTTIDTTWSAGHLSLAMRGPSQISNQIQSFLHDLRCLWRAKPGQYAAIQARDKAFAGVFGLLRARLLRLPFFYWASFPICESYVAIARAQGLKLGVLRWLFLSIKGHVGKYLLYRWLMPRCDHVFVQSDRMKEELVARGIRADRLTPVPMGVDLTRVMRQTAQRPNTSALAGKRVIGYLGTLERARRIDFLFEVVATLRREIPDICLLLVGDAEEADDRRFLVERAAEIGVTDCIVHTGWIPSDTAWAWMRETEIGLSLFPRGELLDSASPTKVVEYLALGIPVVGNDQPDQQHVLEESGAGISVPMDVAGFSAAVLRILRDPALAARMAAAGPPYVRSHRTYDRLGRDLAVVYHRLLGTSVTSFDSAPAADGASAPGAGATPVGSPPVGMTSTGSASLNATSGGTNIESRGSIEMAASRTSVSPTGS